MPPRKPPLQHAGGPNGESPGGERLQKLLAAAGLGSRRECEELITTGRVEVDRKVADELGVRVDPSKQEVRVDGETIHLGRRVYYLVNKSVGVVSTNRDPSGRPRVIDMVPQKFRLFTVGRLDLHSEGLILLTNDGELANRLAHPRYGVEKTYRVVVAGQVDHETLLNLRRGTYLAEAFVRPKSVHIGRKMKKSTVLEVVLSEGRNREIRRLLARFGHKVMQLRRTALGPLKLGDLPVGSYRPLEAKEIRALKDAAAGRTATSTKRQKPTRGAKSTGPQKGSDPKKRRSKVARSKTTARSEGTPGTGKKKSGNKRTSLSKQSKARGGRPAAKKPTSNPTNTKNSRRKGPPKKR